MHDKEAIEGLIREVLDGTELRLNVDTYTLQENLENGEVGIRCCVHNKRTGEEQTIDGHGVGIVDAFFNGLVAMYSAQFPSLHSIRFVDFTITAKLDTGRGARSDSIAEVSLRVANSEARETQFTDKSPSITRSSLNVVLQSVEYFINSERAFIAIYRALQHARKENRADSVQRYTQQLATLVQTTSYTEVIEHLR